jgi:hypothetical protein
MRGPLVGALQSFPGAPFLASNGHLYEYATTRDLTIETNPSPSAANRVNLRVDATRHASVGVCCGIEATSLGATCCDLYHVGGVRGEKAGKARVCCVILLFNLGQRPSSEDGERQAG